jgi:hypothetical protein
MNENIAAPAHGWGKPYAEAKIQPTASGAAALSAWQPWDGVRTAPAGDARERWHVAW